MRLPVTLFASLLFCSGFVSAAESAPTREHFAPGDSAGLYHGWHYSPAVKVGDMVIISGIPAILGETYEASVRAMFEQLKAELASAGATLADVVEITTFHANATDTKRFREEFARFAPIHHEYFPKNYPAWTAVGATALLATGAPVELRAMAVIGSGKNPKADIPKPVATSLADARQSAPPLPLALGPMSAEECAVWERERSFARTAEGRDLRAFAAHVHPQAVFIGGNGPRRGREDIVAAWRGIVEDTGAVRLRWHPQYVAIGPDPTVAISTGPAWFFDKRPDAEDKYLLGAFVSTWKRGQDGQWHVMFDSGGEPRPVTKEQFEASMAGVAAECPRS